MPTDKPKDHKANTPENPTSESQGSIIGGDPQNSGEKHIGSTKPKNNEATDGKPRAIDIHKIPKIDVIEGVEAKRANRISSYATIVNTLILAVTAWVGYTAVHQATIAHDTFVSDTTYSGKNYRNQVANQKKSDSAEKGKFTRDTAAFNLQRRYDSISIKKQEQFFAMQNDQFSIDHQPYLEFAPDTTKMQMKNNYIIRMFFVINNLSQRTIQASRSYIHIFVDKGDTSKFVERIFKKYIKPYPDSRYYSPTHPSQTYCDFIDSANINRRKFLDSREPLYLAGRIEYTN